MRSPAPTSKWFNLLENSFSYALLLRPCVSVIGFQTLAIDRRTQSVQWASPRRISWTYPCEVSGSVGTCPLPPCPSHRIIESPNKGNTCIGESANRFCLLCLSLTLCARKEKELKRALWGRVIVSFCTVLFIFLFSILPWLSPPCDKLFDFVFWLLQIGFFDFLFFFFCYFHFYGDFLFT